MTFEEIKKDGNTHVVMFYGAACAPCNRLKPRIIKLSKEAGFSLHMLNSASEMDAIRTLGIRAVPTVVVVNGNDVKFLFSGEQTDMAILTKLKSAGVV